MSDKGYLVLENGMVFEGEYFGARGEVTGEIVFTTAMTGYVEALTDLSHRGQILLQTFPLIGNYGVTPEDCDSDAAGPVAFIAKHPCKTPSNFRSEDTLDDFMKTRGIIGLCGIDTRRLTRIIRETGSVNGRIAASPSEVVLADIKSHTLKDPVKHVSVTEKKLHKSDNSRYTAAVIDLGAKHSIIRELVKRGCDTWVFPYDTSPEDVLSVKPDGIVLSNGPGNPYDNLETVENVKKLIETGKPVFGICLGHLLLALANGFRAQKLKHGHRGENQPVKDTQSGKVYITSQNHGYEICSESIDEGIAEKWFVNVNNGACEGISYKNSPSFSVQFYPGACGSPRETDFIFERFINSMEVYNAQQGN